MKKSNKVQKPSLGGIIVAEPFMTDPHFARSTVLITEFDAKGTTGFILNKPTKYSVNESVDVFPSFDAKLFYGGPVEDDTLYYVHTIGKKLENSVMLGENLWWGGNYDQLLFLIDTKQVRPNQIRFFAGHAGWEPHQLEFEISEKSWIVHQSSPSIRADVKKWIFDYAPENLWGDVLRSMGDKYKLLANFPSDPNLN
ncbi:MAG: putative transcriptional regulator [Patescibacteria group bacterium]|nr:putative transcriptional regulator [Patescibacteria group bacterium]